jgi:hypothetical protein
MRKQTKAVPFSADAAWQRIPNVTLKSPAMRDFFDQVNGKASTGRFVTLAVPAADRLELRSLFLKVVERHSQSSHVRIMNDNNLPETFELEHDDKTSLLFLNGEELPERLQWAVVENRMNFPVVMLALKTPDEDHSARRRWSSFFINCCTLEALAWPAWALRPDDHADVLDEIIRQIRLPSGAACPVLSAAARDFLLSSSFDGPSHLEWVIDQAVRRYLAMHSNSGLFEVRHFVTRKQLRLLSSHRAVPPLAVIK